MANQPEKGNPRKPHAVSKALPPIHPGGGANSLVAMLRARRIREAEDPLDISHRWRIPKDDFDARAVAAHLGKVWRRWPTEQRILLLLTAESIADAEKAKDARNPRVSYERRLNDLWDMAMTAARLAGEISIAFPPPWEGRRKPIGELVTRLAEFMNGGLNELQAPDKRFSAGFARAMIQKLRLGQSSENGAVRTNWELLRDLAWLASGKELLCSERTIRRYLKEPPRFKLPRKADWKRNWNKIRNVCRLAPERQIEALEDAARNYLLPLKRLPEKGGTKRS